ncbi:MAG: hypothetical protein ABIG64_04140 [Candidatus Omnitrophota bacterium]
MLKNRMFFKLISIMLIQAFLLLQSTYAGGIRENLDYEKNTLAPALILNQQDLKIIFTPESEEIMDGFEFEGTDHPFNMTLNKKPSGSPIKGDNTAFSGEDTLKGIPPPEDGENSSLIENSQIVTSAFGNNDPDEGKDESEVLLPYFDLTNTLNPLAMTLTIRKKFPAGTQKILTEIIRIASGYNDEYWEEGFTQIRAATADDKMAVFRLHNDDNNALGVVEHAIPDLIKLYETPRKFEEVIEVLLIHEGGVSGHAMPWHYRPEDFSFKKFKDTFEDIYIATLRLNIKAGNAYKNLVNILRNRSIPQIKDWSFSGKILVEALLLANYNPNEPDPWGVRWVEAQPNIGVMKQKGVRGVALILWFMREFRSVDLSGYIDLNTQLEQEFPHLKKFGITPDQVKKEMEKIQKEYKAEKNEKPVSGFISGASSLINVSMLFFITTILFQGCTVRQTITMSLVGIIIINILLAIIFARLFFETAIINFVKLLIKAFRAEEKNVSFGKMVPDSKQIDLFNRATSNEKIEILEQLKKKSFLKKSNMAPEVFETYFEVALKAGRGREKLRISGAKAVRDFAAAKLISENFLEQVQPYAKDENVWVAANIIYALILYYGEESRRFFSEEANRLLDAQGFFESKFKSADPKIQDINVSIIAELIETKRKLISNQPIKNKPENTKKRKTLNPDVCINAKQEIPINTLVTLIGSSI